MAWERRRNGQLYFYRSSRDPTTGKVRKQYFGRGHAAEEEAARQSERIARRQAELERRQAAELITDQVAALGANVDGLVETALLAAGYHRPGRKAWRRRRKHGNS